MYFHFSEWGHPDLGCPDRVDIAMDMNETSKECSGEKYIDKLEGLVLPQRWSSEDHGQLGIDFCSKRQMFLNLTFTQTVKK